MLMGFARGRRGVAVRIVLFPRSRGIRHEVGLYEPRSFERKVHPIDFVSVCKVSTRFGLGSLILIKSVQFPYGKLRKYVKTTPLI